MTDPRAEPRRWWTGKPLIGTATEAQDPMRSNDMIEVIEASAYDALVAENAELRSAQTLEQERADKISGNAGVLLDKLEAALKYNGELALDLRVKNRTIDEYIESGLRWKAENEAIQARLDEAERLLGECLERLRCRSNHNVANVVCPGCELLNKLRAREVGK